MVKTLNSIPIVDRLQNAIIGSGDSFTCSCDF